MNVYRWIPSIIWFIITAVLLSIKIDDDGESFIPHIDKIVHLGLFGGQTLTLFWARKKLSVYTVLALILWAGTTELIQHFFIPHRSGETADFITDVLGIALGYVFCIIIKQLTLIRDSIGIF